MLAAVNNGHSGADAIARDIGVARSTVIERLRFLREADMVSSFNNAFKPTEKGIDVLLNAPVLTKGQITAYGHAHAAKLPKVKYEPYTCPELSRNVGLTEDRFTAFALPSRMGNQLRYPDGRIESI